MPLPPICFHLIACAARSHVLPPTAPLWLCVSSADGVYFVSAGASDRVPKVSACMRARACVYVYMCACVRHFSSLDLPPHAQCPCFSLCPQLWYPRLKARERTQDPLSYSFGRQFDFFYLPHPRAITSLSWRAERPNARLVGWLVGWCLLCVCLCVCVRACVRACVCAFCSAVLLHKHAYSQQQARLFVPPPLAPPNHHDNMSSFPLSCN